jgi:hypothetical protein
MEFQVVSNQEELNNLIISIEWHDAFFREFYYLDSSYVIDEKNIYINPEYGNLILLINTENVVKPGLEIIFTKVREVKIIFGNELMDVVGSIINGDYIMNFGGSSEIISGGLRYRFIGKEVWGNRNRYSGKVFFDLDDPLVLEE